MQKQFNTIDEQVQLLQKRGVATDENTPAILLREGYYAVINGYGKAFLDETATAAARDDRFRKGTTFSDIYQLFLFDRELRALTFRAIMCVECCLRSILSHTFCEHHSKPESYLRRGCYTQPREYLLKVSDYEGDLTWMITTLEHHARGYIRDEREGETHDNQRVAWYRTQYGAVPLWVLFSDLTFGNLRYFFALMKRAEQRVVCQRMREACGATHAGKTLSPTIMLADLQTLADLRNACAHEERIYNERFGAGQLTFPQVLNVLVAYLAEDDERRLLRGVRELSKRFSATSEPVAQALRSAGI